MAAAFLVLAAATVAFVSTADTATSKAWNATLTAGELRVVHGIHAGNELYTLFLGIDTASGTPNPGQALSLAGVRYPNTLTGDHFVVRTL